MYDCAMCNFFQKSESSKYRKSVSDIWIRIRFLFEGSFRIFVSGCKLTILPNIQPANRIVIISGAYTAAILMGRVSVFRLRIEQGNKLPFDNTNPEDRMA